MEPNEFERNQAKEAYYKAIAVEQMHLNIIEKFGPLTPYHIEIVKVLATATLNELSQRNLLKSFDEMMTDEVKKIANDPKAAKEFVKLCGDKIATLPSEALNQLPKEAFE